MTKKTETKKTTTPVVRKKRSLWSAAKPVELFGIAACLTVIGVLVYILTVRVYL
jgi:hypothetical protein